MFTELIPGSAASPAAAVQVDAAVRFSRLLEAALAAGSFVKLLLSKPVGAEDQLERLLVREVRLHGERQLSFLWRHATRDVTKNHPLAEGLPLINQLLGVRFHNAHLHTHTAEVQLAYSRKGRPSLRLGKPTNAVLEVPAEPSHDKEKQRPLALDRPFWADLGVTHRVRDELLLVPAMSRKWKQINKFIEVLAAALKRSTLADSPEVHVADFGSGKGYLTFAMHDWLRSQGKVARVSGVELREDMVKLCNEAARRHGMDGLKFDLGDVRSYEPARLDVMVALHACDTATDHAIHLGLRAGAAIIMCSPCCHKQLRPQMRSPAALRPLLQHGIHMGQEAEMVTDSLRAMLLEAMGYETQVFEFVALEHTSKNKMILAVKRSGDAAAAAAAQRPELLAQMAEIKCFYGLREQCLETLLQADGSLPAV
jgi:Methyltransferase domain